MNIDCGKYILRSDPLNLWIEEKYPKVKGGEASKVVTGYAQDFEHLLESFTRRKIRGAEASTMKELLMEMKRIESDLQELAASLANQLEVEGRWKK